MNDLIKKFNLPKYIKGKSFSDASKLIEGKFKDRLDKVSLNTKKELLNRLSKAQEYTKMQQSLKENSTQVPDQLDGQIPQGMEQYTQNQSNDGGYIEDEGTGNYMQAAQGVLEMGNSLFGKPKQVNPDENKVSGSNAAIGGALKGAQAGMAFGPWGAAIGGLAGGVSGLIGGKKRNNAIEEVKENQTHLAYNNLMNNYSFGGYSNLNTNPSNNDPKNKKPKPTLENINTIKSNMEKQGRGFNAQEVADLAKKGIVVEEGGDSNLFDISDSPVERGHLPELNLGRYKGLDYFDVQGNGQSYNISPTRNNPANARMFRDNLKYLQGLNPNANIMKDGHKNNYIPSQNRKANGGYVNTYAEGGKLPIKEDTDASVFGADEFKGSVPQVDASIPSTKTPGFGDKAVDWLGQNYGNVMRYAPVAANAVELAKLKKAKDPVRDRLRNRFKKTSVDERRLLNEVNNSNITGAITEASGGNLGSLRSNLLASQLNKTKAISDAYTKVEDVNRDQDNKKQQFDLNIDRTNLGQSNLDEVDSQANEGAYQSAKSQLKKSLYEDIGNIGKEEVNKKLVKEMFGYKWNGKYYVDSKGNKHDKKDVAAQIEEIRSKRK